MNRERFLRMNDNGGEDFLHAGTVGSWRPRSVPISSPPSAPAGVGVNGAASCVVHTVSKFDTLAGIAIKYGVEVADIKRLNGLATDLQMFALKTIQIPLPGRHPPSPSLSNGCDTPPRPSSSQQTLSSRRRSDLFNLFPSLKLKSSSEQKVSPAMSILQSYYASKPEDQKGAAEGFEMAVYQKGGAHYSEDEPFTKSSPISNPPLSQPRKSKSTASFLASENVNNTDQVLSQESENTSLDKSTEKMVRQRQKSEADFTVQTPEKILKEENTSSSSISPITGKSLALRPKSANRNASQGMDGETGGPKPIPIGFGDSLLTDTVSSGVQKSSSASSLQDSENNTLSSIWPISLKPDFQALTSIAIAGPILDGLSKPMSRRNKAAVD